MGEDPFSRSRSRMGTGRVAVGCERSVSLGRSVGQAFHGYCASGIECRAAYYMLAVDL